MGGGGRGVGGGGSATAEEAVQVQSASAKILSLHKRVFVNMSKRRGRRTVSGRLKLICLQALLCIRSARHCPANARGAGTPMSCGAFRECGD